MFSIRYGWVGLNKIAEAMKRGSKRVSITLLQHTESEIAKILKEKARLVKPNLYVGDLSPL